jgi:hypothetical protein
MKRLILWSLVMLWAGPLWCQPLQRFELVITEIMADPLPAVGLPASEFIELKNTTNRPIRLDGCRITDGVSTGIIPAGTLLPADSFLILCPKNNATAFSGYGRVTGLNTFPSIDNDGDEIMLLSAEGAVLHAIRFNVTDYRNAIKQAGGWSLEMIDIRFPCHGTENWVASVSLDGGTPGRINSVTFARADPSPPRPLRTWTVDSLKMMVQFDEGLDSASASRLPSYTLGSDAPRIINIQTIRPFYDQVMLTLDAPMLRARVYSLEVKSIRDCQGNIMAAPVSVKAGRPEPSKPGQVMINEILFDPKPGGADYVELLNLGPGILDAGTLLLGNAVNSGTAGNFKPLQSMSRLIFPGDHIVCTADPGNILKEYEVKERDWLWRMENIPSYPDDAGTVVVADVTGRELDRLNYKAEMHFPLLGNREGVALERVRPSTGTEFTGNWHSASSSAGYGTPTGRNSQYMVTDSLQGELKVSSKIISPDLDGIDDQLTINWRLPHPGNIISIRILDSHGRLIKMLIRHGLAGTTGSINWDGLNERQGRLPAGPYIVWTETLDTRGKSKIWKHPFVLAYR